MPSAAALEVLAFARQIADYAGRSGVRLSLTTSRAAADHIGAVLADAILQSGLNYRTVVKPRVDRIIVSFPEAITLTGVRAIIDREMTSDFLQWKHPTKITRFIMLAELLGAEGVEHIGDLKQWLVHRESHDRLLHLKGIGPKTYDYICCLVGIDCVAVDRHIMTFVTEAGVPVGDYDKVKVIVSYAADLLGVSRRDFDAWIWNSMSRQSRGIASTSSEG